MSAPHLWVFACLWIFSGCVIVIARVKRDNPQRKVLIVCYFAMFAGFGLLAAWIHHGVPATVAGLSGIASVMGLRLAIGRVL